MWICFYFDVVFDWCEEYVEIFEGIMIILIEFIGGMLVYFVWWVFGFGVLGLYWGYGLCE